MKKNLILFLCSIPLFTLVVSAQEDSLRKVNDPSPQIISDKMIETDSSVHSPRKAALYSALLPGLGQAYNKKYWKIPIIYGLGGTLGYFIRFNNRTYLGFKSSLDAKLEGRADGDLYPFLSETAVQRNRDYFKRNRELLIILSVLLHGLNIVDATVDAHLQSFDVGDDLTFHFEPSLEQVGGGAFAGMSFKIIFK